MGQVQQALESAADVGIFQLQLRHHAATLPSQHHQTDIPSHWQFSEILVLADSFFKLWQFCGIETFRRHQRAFDPFGVGAVDGFPKLPARLLLRGASNDGWRLCSNQVVCNGIVQELIHHMVVMPGKGFIHLIGEKFLHPGWGLSQGHDAFAGLAGHVILELFHPSSKCVNTILQVFRQLRLLLFGFAIATTHILHHAVKGSPQ
mmetsp:Transcript_54501/g.119317  ORF Transcript_54501/g.119317 Transcript_54501/m.119317 type:complete len:204 (-) Transcript_54501:48-659(-)